MNSQSIANRTFEFVKYSLLALYPILSIYNSMLIFDLGTLLLFVFMIIEIATNKGNFEINATLFVVFAILAALNIITGFIHMDIISIKGCVSNSLQLLINAIIYAYYIKKAIVKMDVFYEYLRVVALISSLFLFLQFILYLKSIVLYGFIPFLHVSEDALAVVKNASVSYGRPNSFFAEPAHFSIYVLPVYAISLFRKKYITSVILLLALILSTSTTGIIAAVMVAGFYIIKEKRIPVMIKWILFLAVLMIVFKYIPLLKESGVLEKMSFISIKSNIRVLGTFIYFKHFNIIEIIFGVGLNQLSAYMSYFVATSVTNYANSFFFSFFSFGLIGGTIWTGYIIKLNNLSRNKVLYLIFILICLTDQILFNRNLFYLLLLLFVFSDKEHELLQIKQQKSGEICE